MEYAIPCLASRTLEQPPPTHLYGIITKKFNSLSKDNRMKPFKDATTSYAFSLMSQPRLLIELLCSVMGKGNIYINASECIFFRKLFRALSKLI